MNTRIQLPQGMAYGWWNFPVPAFDDLTFEIDIQAVDPRVGIYNQLYQGKIAGVGFYLGFQTNLSKLGSGPVGPGFIFSRWETRNIQNARSVPEGYIESSGHEGDFIGIRLPYS